MLLELTFCWALVYHGVNSKLSVETINVQLSESFTPFRTDSHSQWDKMWSVETEKLTLK